MKAVEIKNFSWKYDKARDYALKDINLEINDNEFIGVIGPNESGKTTLMNVIKGIIPQNFTGIYKGDVKIYGDDVAGLSPIEITRRVGMVFADPESQFNSMSVEEEITFGMENIGLGIDEIATRLNNVCRLTDIQNLLEKPPYNLSGGQKQRIAIASILAMQPKIIILDEPTSMLDPISKDMIFDLLKIMKTELKLTVIVVEHNIEQLVEICDKFLLVNKGVIEKYDNTEEFFTNIDFLDSRNVRVPSGIKIINKIGNLNKPKSLPIKFEEIVKVLTKILDKNRSKQYEYK
ncbi:energy-coupling factor ABC transporter ATP-binding protein [Miniphocaeibacter halophilus]|uniref:ABC transporter ATP-binding protein n=1 Tax=Miniphocaeibacter halophilus TaxID=2931922 RepID=A0AC61MMV9_9FIRM|nr:ABC transporter ATP-binding protein [Miniphocaeibacter halophilus]QQK06955.1 ABC transporter ATP-binding protein [Miniphocaeibacter halophilus]